MKIIKRYFLKIIYFLLLGAEIFEARLCPFQVQLNMGGP